MLIIGLTGGICSGKSTVTGLFKELGTSVLDADIVARELVEPGQPALQEIINLFGSEVLGDDGKLDRTRLRTRIFSHTEDRKQLEAILHPRIRERMAVLTRDSNAPWCIQVIPLLIETGQSQDVDRVLVVDTSEADQKRRLAQRDNSSTEQIKAILASQTDRQHRLKQADDIIINDGTLGELRKQVILMHRKYTLLSQNNAQNLHRKRS
ncbi:MAG TPA: dephospho-CoA kinase [Gammaproteobacteria bacterium]|nr:dephospho-CoA kinase [Gammaproteobacteria bacterium]